MRVKRMKPLIYVITTVFLILVMIGSYFLLSEWRIHRQINIMTDNNETFDMLLQGEGIDLSDYVCYEEVFVGDGHYQLVFTEETTAFYDEGTMVDAILLDIVSDIETMYRPDVTLHQEDSTYQLPYLWIAGGGKTYGTALAFAKRSELRCLIIEHNQGITISHITLKIEGSHCLGKLEF